LAVTVQLKVVPFFFDGNAWSGIVQPVDDLYDLLSCYDIDAICRAKMATTVNISGLPESYHIGAMDVRSGQLTSFGFRREHQGPLTLETWATGRGMSVRKLAKRKARA
jgi:hypothetical protein